MGARTEELRATARARGMAVTHGYLLADGHRTDEDRVTTLWADPGDPLTSLTFEEDEDGALWCADDMSPEQAMGAALAGLEAARAGRHE